MRFVIPPQDSITGFHHKIVNVHMFAGPDGRCGHTDDLPKATNRRSQSIRALPLYLRLEFPPVRERLTDKHAIDKLMTGDGDIVA
jgi:hypothetical protein